MARFIAEHSGAWSEEQLTGMAQQIMPQIPPGFAWKQTYCDMSGNKYYCEWDAPSKEALEQAFQANNIPFDMVRPVTRFDPAAMKFEP